MKNRSLLLSILLCVLLILPLLIPAGAEMTISGEGDTYVLNHRVTGDGYDGPDLQYFSPYRIAARMDGKSITMKNCLFSLYNTVNDQVIPVYCTDISVLANANYTYRRINLEDSTFAADAADQLRAIMRNGFYVMPITGETDAEHAVRVAEELKRLGEAAGVPDLTIGEAITGTQSAIWQAAHGSDLVFTDLLHNMYTDDVSDTVRYYDICNEERINGHVQYTSVSNGNATLTPASDAWVGGRITAVYNYLLSLEPLPPSAIVVSPASFLDVTGPNSSRNDDGTYDLTVTARVNVHMEPGDTLTLTADIGNGYQASAPLSDGVQTVTLTIKNVPASQMDESITLSIRGMQSGLDVYLFDSEGGRYTSQSMIGMDDSRLPVYAEVVVNQDRILNFVKTTREASGTNDYVNHPLEGITFDIYYVASMTELTNGTVILPEAVDYPLPASPDYTVTTDEAGKASVNFTKNGLPDGAYLVVEREHPAIEAPIDPFYLYMPTTSEDGSGLQYQVTVKPKNDVKGNVTIDKDVTSLGNDSSSVNAYEDHTWIISTSIPEDIGKGKSYVISDTLDNRLDYKGNLSVKLESNDGQTVLATLTEGADYTLQVADVDSLSEGNPSDSFTVSLTPAGMQKIANAIGSGSFSDYKLRVYFNAQINANAEAGEEIPNQAELKYTNSVNFDFHVTSDEPVVYTGGTNLLKVDAVNAVKVLPGAVFEVYRYATADEVAAGGDQITHIEGVSGAVVKVSFFDNPDLTGEKVTSVTTDAEGKAAIYGLAYGDYFLLETQAPPSYNPPEGAVAITIDGGSHSLDNTVTVKNVGGSMLPSTGGIGTGIFYFAGIAAVCAAAWIVLSQKRKAC